MVSGIKNDTRERREESPENAGIKNDTRECRDECPKRNVGIKKDTREYSGGETTPTYYKITRLTFSGTKKDTQEQGGVPQYSCGYEKAPQEIREECTSYLSGTKKDTQE